MESKSNETSVCTCHNKKQNVTNCTNGVQLKKDNKMWNKFCICEKRKCPPVKPKCTGNLVKFTVKSSKTYASKTYVSKTGASKTCASETGASETAGSKICVNKMGVSKTGASKTGVSKTS